MNINEEPVDEVKEALIAFFERQGGHKSVADVTGVNPQQLYYIVTGRNDPTCFNPSYRGLAFRIVGG